MLADLPSFWIRKGIKTKNTLIVTVLLKYITLYIYIYLSLLFVDDAYFREGEFTNNEFPGKLKLANVSPIFKSGESTQKGNYRPISVL